MSAGNTITIFTIPVFTDGTFYVELGDQSITSGFIVSPYTSLGEPLLTSTPPGDPGEPPEFPDPTWSSSSVNLTPKEVPPFNTSEKFSLDIKLEEPQLGPFPDDFPMKFSGGDGAPELLDLLLELGLLNLLLPATANSPDSILVTDPAPLAAPAPAPAPDLTLPDPAAEAEGELIIDLRHEHIDDRVVDLYITLTAEEYREAYGGDIPDGNSYLWEYEYPIGSDIWIQLATTDVPFFDQMSVIPGDEYFVRVTVTYADGNSATSDPWDFYVYTAPEIIDLANDQGYDDGSDAHFAALSEEVNSEDPELTYQWQELINGVWVDLEGATNKAFNHMNVAFNQEHIVRSIVTNSQLTKTVSEQYTFTLVLSLFTS